MSKWIGRFGFVCLCAASTPWLAACSGGDGSARNVEHAGTLTMALGGIGDRGNRYRLRAADFALAGPTAQSFSSEDFLGRDQIDFELPVGSYTLTLSGAWFLERLTINGYQQVANATLLSPAQASFGIAGNTNTGIVFAFQVGDEVVVPGSDTGTLTVGTSVHETSGSTLCGNGTLDPGEACDDGNDDPCDGCAACQTRELPTPGPIEAPALILEDTIWCAAQSPVHMASNVIVLQGATLFVGPGTRVEADNNVGFQVRGRFRVNGTSEARAVFTSSAAAPALGAWNGIGLGGTEQTVLSNFEIHFASTGVSGSGDTQVKHAVFDHNSVGLSNSTSIVDSVFTDNQVGVASSSISPVVEDSVFERNTRYGLESAGIVRRSRFSHNGLDGTGSVFACGPAGCGVHGAAIQGGGRIESSVFLNNDVALKSAGEIVDSQFVANNFAVLSADHIENALVADNLVGVQEVDALFQSTLVRNGGSLLVFGSTQIHGNTLCNNGALELTNSNTAFVDVTDNFWCTTDRDAIAGRIRDVFDDSALGPVVFEPFLTAAPAAAPVDPGPPSEPAPGASPP